MIRAAIYARYSSDNQREESITAQVRACTEYCERKEYRVVRVYADEAYSALTDDRPQFRRMVEEAKLGLFDVLVVHKLDRFARNRYDSVFYKRELRRAGVRVESVLEHLDDSPESVLMESLLEGLAEYYSRNLAREALKGMKETALQGKHVGGVPPLGYDVGPDRRYVVNEREAEAVRLIFEMYDRGYGYGEIIKELEARGFRTKQGRPFCKNSLHDILRNEKYIGVYVFNKRQGRTVDGLKNNRRLKPREEMVVLPGAIPAIVDEDLFWRVQEKMDARRRNSEKARQRAKVVYLLSGLIECGKCGAAYVGNSGGWKTVGGERKRIYYYECGARDRSRTCSNRRIRKDTVEGLVLAQIEETLFSPEAKALLKERLLEYYEQHKRELVGELERLERKRAGLKAAVANLLRLVEEGRATESVLRQLERREAELRAVEEEMRCAGRREELVVTEEDVEAYLEDLHGRLKNKKDEDLLKALVRQLIEKVVVREDGIEVVFRVTLVTDGGGGLCWTVTKVFNREQELVSLNCAALSLYLPQPRRRCSSSPARRASSTHPSVR